MTKAQLIAALGAARPLDTGSGPWTVRFIDIADRQFQGQWREADLTGLDALEIVLPPHAGEPCKGDRLPLVAVGGATVREAAERLRTMRVEYERANPSCWSRIADASTQPFSRLILTAAPLDSDDHRRLTTISGALYHLDGFHRLLGWALAGRLTAETMIETVIAGVRREA